MEEDRETELSISRINKRIVILDTVCSTNDYAKKLVASGSLEDFIIFAFEQTAGGGRYGREWTSPRGGAWFSLVLTIPDIRYASALLFKSALAVSDAIRMKEVKTQIRWPNDIMICGKKVSGCLLETVKGNDGEIRAVIGIGVNVNINEDILKEAGLYETATSLMIETGEEHDILDLMYAVVSITINYFEKSLLLSTDEINKINSVLYKKGEHVTLTINSNKICGICTGLSEDGLISIIDENDNIFSYSHSEVTAFR